MLGVAELLVGGIVIVLPLRGIREAERIGATILCERELRIV
jgi:hypothetical protein